MKPKLTVITPVYNGEKYILETIKSVMRQNYPLQYIIIDDGSTDATREILKPFEIVDDMFIITRGNMGEQKTINQALRLVRTKYFMVVNADDPLLLGSISKLVNFMEDNPQYVCAYPDWIVIDENGKWISRNQSREYDYKFMVRHHFCLPSVGSIVRSSVLSHPIFKNTGPRDVSYRWIGDFTFWLKLGLIGKMARLPDTLATWRRHPDQASNINGSLRAAEHVRIIEDYYKLPDIPDDILDVKNEARCWSNLVAAVVTNNKVESISYILDAIIAWPKLFFSLEFYDIFKKRLRRFLITRKGKESE